MAAPMGDTIETAPPRLGPHPGPSQLSLRARLNLLVALCVIPLLALTLGGDYVEYRTVRAATEARALAQAREFADDVARLLQAELAALQTLALSADLHTGRLDSFRAKGAAFLALRGAPASLRVNDPTGRAALMIGPPGLPPSAAMLHTLLANGRPVVSGYQEAAFGDRPGFCLHMPVTVNGQVTWDLQITLDLTALRPVMNAQMPPENWGLLIADGTGRTLARRPSVPPLAGALLSPTLRAAMHRAGAGSQSGTRADGMPMRRFFATVPGGDWADGSWQVVLGIPSGILLAPLYRTVGTALLAGAGLLAAGLLLAGVMARGITAPIARLQRLAAAPDEADLRRAPTGLAETDGVADALAAAAAGRRDALARLQTLAETLEHRVGAEVAAREAAQLEAARGERLRALGQLAGGIAHDVNNVLQTVTLTSQLLAARSADPNEVVRLARRLAHAAQQGMAITGRLLGFTRVQRPPAPEPFDLRPLLDELQDMLRTMLGEAVTMAVATPTDLPPVLADRGRMETVLINLAINARDAMPHGGTLRFAAAIADVTPPVAVRPGRHILLEVTDTGTGMPPEVLARVTEPFFTTKAAGRGTGLGLSLAHSFAEQSGGALAIESAPGRGTTVRLWLPAAD
jgi:signal transduction histidine kinase